MSRLGAVQRAFAASLHDPQAHPGLEHWLVGDLHSSDRRMAVYRANVVGAVGKALEAAYPVTLQVVGNEFFEGLVRAFSRSTQSTGGDLTDYGQGFAAFLAAFPHAKTLPYLSDLARLEWRVHCAYGAQDAPTLEFARLASIDGQRQGGICLDWAPGTAIVESGYPIARIWNIHQQDADSDFSVAWSVAEKALVARDGFRVTVRAMSSGEMAFVSSSLQGAALGEALENALDEEAGFDLADFLGRAAASRLVCGFSESKVD